jgi:hypothetical protein
VLVSSRRALHLLATRVASFEQARRLLQSGAAGPPASVGGVVAYDQDMVLDLATRPWVDENALAEACPWGVHIARLGRDRSLDVTLPWEELADRVAHQRALPPMTATLLGVRMKISEGLPWVATVSGYVVFGAETTGWQPLGDGAVRFALRPPGAWFRIVERRWFAFGPGRHWFFWDPWRLQQ